jgi:hypothetical protein
MALVLNQTRPRRRARGGGRLDTINTHDLAAAAATPAQGQVPRGGPRRSFRTEASAISLIATLMRVEDKPWVN